MAPALSLTTPGCVIIQNCARTLRGIALLESLKLHLSTEAIKAHKPVGWPVRTGVLFLYAITDFSQAQCQGENRPIAGNKKPPHRAADS